MPAGEPAALCGFCGSPVVLGAKKCPSCLEFLDGIERKGDSGQSVRAEVVKGVFAVLGRAAIPATVLVALFLFRAEISSKLSGTESIQLGSYGIKFSFPENRGGSVELDALALYYLLDTARHEPGYEGGLNYASLNTEAKKAIEALKDGGLVTARVTELSDEEAEKTFKIKTSLTLNITDKGRSFLRSAKLDNILPAKQHP